MFDFRRVEHYIYVYASQRIFNYVVPRPEYREGDTVQYIHGIHIHGIHTTYTCTYIHNEQHVCSTYIYIYIIYVCSSSSE